MRRVRRHRALSRGIEADVAQVVELMAYYAGRMMSIDNAIGS